METLYPWVIFKLYSYSQILTLTFRVSPVNILNRLRIVGFAFVSYQVLLIAVQRRNYTNDEQHIICQLHVRFQANFLTPNIMDAKLTFTKLRLNLIFSCFCSSVVPFSLWITYRFPTMLLSRFHFRLTVK